MFVNIFLFGAVQLLSFCMAAIDFDQQNIPECLSRNQVCSLCIDEIIDNLNQHCPGTTKIDGVVSKHQELKKKIEENGGKRLCRTKKHFLETQCCQGHRYMKECKYRQKHENFLKILGRLLSTQAGYKLEREKSIPKPEFDLWIESMRHVLQISRHIPCIMQHIHD